MPNVPPTESRKPNPLKSKSKSSAPTLKSPKSSVSPGPSNNSNFQSDSSPNISKLSMNNKNKTSNITTIIGQSSTNCDIVPLPWIFYIGPMAKPDRYTFLSTNPNGPLPPAIPNESKYIYRIKFSLPLQVEGSDHYKNSIDYVNYTHDNKIYTYNHTNNMKNDNDDKNERLQTKEESILVLVYRAAKIFSKYSEGPLPTEPIEFIPNCLANTKPLIEETIFSSNDLKKIRSHRQN